MLYTKPTQTISTVSAGYDMSQNIPSCGGVLANNELSLKLNNFFNFLPFFSLFFLLGDMIGGMSDPVESALKTTIRKKELAFVSDKFTRLILLII